LGDALLIPNGRLGGQPPKPDSGNHHSNSQYELQQREFAPDGRKLSLLKPENSPPKAGCFRARFQNENCYNHHLIYIKSG